MIQDIIPGTEEKLNEGPAVGYIGFDPTSDSLHIGSLAPGSVATGTIWVDNGTSGVLKVKINDGSDNVELFQINISSNAITSTMSVTGTISETDPQAAALAIALG